ncbi:hypothetical protein AB1Y20_000162 [Prymnesium parvum]|uniref:MalT-like TPR region domain-containing protein n=1 Tax=Prymnesium parvum TaxID=97485 RepID=A0AB34K4K1_PRYPA
MASLMRAPSRGVALSKSRGISTGWYQPETSPLPLELGSRPSTSWAAPAHASAASHRRPATAAAVPRHRQEGALRLGNLADQQLSVVHMQESAFRALPPSPRSRGFRGARFAPHRGAAHISHPQPAWSAISALEPLTPPSPPRPVDGNPPMYRLNEPLHVEAPSQWGAPARVGAPLTFGGMGGVAVGGAGGRTASNLQDYHMIATACLRAGRRRDEALAHYSSGVLLDNSGRGARAAGCYSRMLAAGVAAADKTTQLVAHNCLGVLKHRAADYEGAIAHHRKHLELADASGMFTPHLNLGLALAELSNYTEAQEHLREALRHSIRMNSLTLESLACGNLATVGKRAGDLETASSCLDRYLRLASTLNDEVGKADAHQLLADLAVQMGDLEDAGSHFETSLTLSGQQPERQAVHNVTKVELGVAQGQLQFEHFLRETFS